MIGSGPLPTQAFQWVSLTTTVNTTAYTPEGARRMLLDRVAQGERWTLGSVISAGDGPSWHGGVDAEVHVTRQLPDGRVVQTSGKAALSCIGSVIFVLSLGDDQNADPPGSADCESADAVTERSECTRTPGRSLPHVTDPSTSIRPAEPRDAAGIARVHIRTWQVAYRGQLPEAFLDGLGAEIDQRTSRWESFIADAASVQLVAQDGDRLVGFVAFGPSGDEPVDPRIGEVYAIYVDPSCWDRGYGRALFTTAVRGLTDAGFAEATLWVLDTNSRARRFYEIAGWVADGAVKTEHQGGIQLREVRYRLRPLKEDPAQS